MKFSLVPILLAISMALAAPMHSKRGNTFEITKFYANKATVGDSAYMHFILNDANYPRDTPTQCNIIWQYGEQPPLNARCLNSQYYIKFPQGPVDLNNFTLALQRVNGSIPEKGEVQLNSNAPGSKWACYSDPRQGVSLACAYEGTLDISA